MGAGQSSNNRSRGKEADMLFFANVDWKSQPRQVIARRSHRVQAAATTMTWHQLCPLLANDSSLGQRVLSRKGLLELLCQ